MSYLATNPEGYLGQSVGSGQCVDYVRAATKAPPSASWRRGRPVANATDLAYGTAIATFDEDGRYGSRKDGSCHAAIFLRLQPGIGIVVLDQWVTEGKPQPTHQRTIRFGSKFGSKVNHAEAYYVIE